MFSFSLFNKRKAPSDQKLQAILRGWEHSTCLGSDYYHKKEYQAAILQFEKALGYARSGLECRAEKAIFMQYYSLASMNLAQALNCYQQQPQSEKVLSDAHFNMLSMMVDAAEPESHRYEAKKQAEFLLRNLIDFLASMGRKSVADSLLEEFTRLKITSGVFSKV